MRKSRFPVSVSAAFIIVLVPVWVAGAGAIVAAIWLATALLAASCLSLGVWALADKGSEIVPSWDRYDITDALHEAATMELMVRSQRFALS